MITNVIFKIVIFLRLRNTLQKMLWNDFTICDIITILECKYIMKYGKDPPVQTLWWLKLIVMIEVKFIKRVSASRVKIS